MTQICLQSVPTEGHTLEAAALLYRQHLQCVGRAVSVAEVAAGTWWAQKTKACFFVFCFVCWMRHRDTIAANTAL